MIKKRVDIPLISILKSTLNQTLYQDVPQDFAIILISSLDILPQF